MAICDWPESERPREKLIQHSAKHLSNAELLTLLIGSGQRGLSSIDIARQSLQHFSILKQLLNAELKAFCEVPGLGPARFAVLQAVKEIQCRYLLEELKQTPQLNNPKQTANFLKTRLQDYSHEVFACLYLTTQHQVICFKEISHGDLCSVDVPIRKLIKYALQENAAAIIIAHNHPSGSLTPSMGILN